MLKLYWHSNLNRKMFLGPSNVIINIEDCIIIGIVGVDVVFTIKRISTG